MVDVATLIANVLKVQYFDNEIKDHTYRQQAILPNLKNIMKRATGKNFSFTIQSQVLDTTRFIAEQGTLKTAAGPEYARGYDDLKTIYTRQSATWESLKDSAGDAGALASMAVRIPYEMSEQQAFKIALHAWIGENMSTFGGDLAKCTAEATDTNAITLAANSNMRRFLEGMYLDARSMTTGALATAGTDDFDSKRVLYTDDDAWELYLNTTDVATGVQVAATDGLYIEDEVSSTTYYGPNSIPVLIGTGTLHQINTATYPAFKSIVKTSCGTLTPNKIQDVVDSIEAHYQKGIDVIITSPEVCQEYADIFVPNVQYRPEDFGKLVGGYPTTMYFSGASRGPIPIVKDALCPLDQMFFISWDCFSLFASAWLEWVTKMDPIAGYLEWDFVFASRYQMVVTNRKGTGKITGITISPNP